MSQSQPILPLLMLCTPTHPNVYIIHKNSPLISIQAFDVYIPKFHWPCILCFSNPYSDLNRGLHHILPPSIIYICEILVSQTLHIFKPLWNFPSYLCALPFFFTLHIILRNFTSINKGIQYLFVYFSHADVTQTFIRRSNVPTRELVTR